MKQRWWHEAIIYQIYPKSFKDSDKNGIGDIKGMTSSLEYVKSLGVNAIWINPIFVSPQIDNGYDISNFYAIDDNFGTLEQVEDLIKEAHKREIKVIFDLVLNHTSSKHPWFQEALKGKNNIYRDYYLWSDPNSHGGPPNNWASFFGGSVWEKDERSNQYYFHLFDKEMPDLNWKNLEVQKAMLDIARYWMSKGIDGFRLDAFIHIAKDDFSKQVQGNGDTPQIAEQYYANLPQVKTYLNQFIEELKKIKPDIFILGEAASATPAKAFEYVSDELCGAIISFDHLKENAKSHLLDYDAFKQSMKEWQKTFTGEYYPTLYWNNHDMPRVLSRFGNTEKYRVQSAKALATAMYLLKGIPVIYYGEEIGMKNLTVSSIDFFEDSKIVDNYYDLVKKTNQAPQKILLTLANNHKEVGRGCMQWDYKKYTGFSDDAPWNGVNEESGYNVFEQEKKTDSILNFYRDLLELKKQPIFQRGETIFLETPSEIFAYSRVLDKKEMIVVVNLSDRLIEGVKDVFAGYDESHRVLGNIENMNNGLIAPYEFIVFKR